MILTANSIYGAASRCRDGFQGTIDDLLFDDDSWHVTYLVIRFGSWLSPHRVLVTPHDIAGADWPGRRVELRLDGSGLQAAPPLESHPPVALQKSRELELVAWDAYWSGVLSDPHTPGGDPHLRNMRGLVGHHVLGLDAEAGIVDNFVVDDRQWRVRYLVVRIGRWRSVQRVVLEPRWVDAIVWEHAGVYIHLPKSEIEHGRQWSDEERAVVS